MSEVKQLLFYKNPVPIMLDKHQDSGINKEGDYKFAKLTNSVPVNIQEFPEVCKYYTIAFANDGSPVVILGIKSNANLFVDKDGNWSRNLYVPAYIRRYPFAFMAYDKNLILCVDENSERFAKKAKKADLRFFDTAKKQSELTKGAMAFCQQFHVDSLITREFGKALIEQDLLIEQQANFNIKGEKTPLVLSGFGVVNQTKFTDLPIEILQEWHKNGYLSLINLHLMSLGNISKLPELYSKTPFKKLEKKKLKTKKS